MPKNNNSRPKSSRKPLREISNGGLISSKQSNGNKIEQQQGNSLDRLFLVHSDLTNLIQQIDELVVQAVKVEGTTKKGNNEIDLFTSFLSDTHTSLKSWIPRFQKLLTDPSVDSQSQLDQSSLCKTLPAANEENINVDDTPVQSEMDSFVSPSPLVSWCAERTVESGRQLFMLTPLPRSRQVSSKLRSSSRSVLARKMVSPKSTNPRILPLLSNCQNADDDLVEGKDTKSKLTPNKCSKLSVTVMESSLDHGFVSPPPRFVNRNRSMFLMTPRLKMSPPKTCVLLEPIKESYQQDGNYRFKRTPFHVGTRSRTRNRNATPYRSHFSKSLTLKYPELLGAHQADTSTKGNKQVDAVLERLMSPPKSCVLMESPDKKPLATCSILDEQNASLTAASYKGVQGGNQSIKPGYNQEVGSTSKTYLECTPMLKEPGSRVNRGRQPGENTLKKELWTRFEAASSSSNLLRLDVSVLRDTSTKGFLDRLEEEV